MRHLPFLALLITALSSNAETFVHEASKTYLAPAEPQVQAKLASWRDLKFGMLIHWGLYAQLGIVESWSICSEEEDWIPRDSTISYDAYKRSYWATINDFNPLKFDPAAWADVGREGGMKYVVFTTKHHDGFAMFDTKHSDFSITHGAFAGDPRRNVAREVFNAFRQKDYMLGAYFSKPDWHSQYYWWDRYATPNRSVNYSILKNPWRWGMFKQLVYNQIEELVGGDYGELDILWLDGGWVRPAREGDAERRGYPGAQDVDMPRIASMVRHHQPSMLIVDRTVPGIYENYQTPERGVPANAMSTPWESCIPLGNDWGFVPNDPYKSPTRVVHTLAEIVAKGGNLLLGIGPQPDGTLPEGVVERMKRIGEWLKANSEAIYGTRTAPQYRDANTWFTLSVNGKKLYAIACLDENSPLPKAIAWQGNLPRKGAKITLLQTGKPLKWRQVEAGVEVLLPATLELAGGVKAVALAIEWQ